MTLDKVPAGPGNTLAHIFLHRAVLGPAALLIVQQLIVASSTVWLTKLASAVAAGAPLTPWLTLYLLSLALPYLPGSWMLYQLERWSLASQDRLLSFTDAAWYGKALHWGDTGQRAQLLALYSKEAPRLVEQFTHYSYSLASCTLNALFSIVMLALVVEPRLLLAYLVSLLLVALVIKLQARHNEQLAVVAQARRLDWSDAQLGMWDNTLLGNAYNHSLWLAKTRSAFRAMTRAVLRSTWFNQAVTLLIMVATQLPMVLVLCRYLLAEPSSVAAAALVVSLPRLFQIVMH